MSRTARPSRLLTTTCLAILLLLVACSEDSKSSASDVIADGSPDTTETAGTETEVVAPGFCLDDIDSDDSFPIPGLTAPVEVVLDDYGVPHIYAENKADLFTAEGFVVARYRFIQMHAMRAISSGAFSSAPSAGAGDLSTDVYMRILNMRGVAEEIWTKTQADEPEITVMLESFAKGVNAYIQAVRDREVPEPLEWAFLGDIPDWSPVDSLVIGRLQSWDLSFESNGDKIAMLERVLALSARFEGTPLAGIIEDLHPIAPATEAIALPDGIEVNERSSAMRFAGLASSFFQRLDRGALSRARKALSKLGMKPGALAVAGYGSNNWVISGEHTSSGDALLANDTHLSLRNPAVFFELHMDTTRAGGDLSLAGVCFPGIPGLILGSNGHAAWGATVYYSDVTDVYLEEWTEGTPSTVLLDGAQVEVEIRDEVFDYQRTAEGCESWLDDFIKGTSYEVEETDTGCRLTVHVEVVPHHGPVIPGSKGKDMNGKDSAMTWKWTGFEPSDEMKTVYGYMTMRSPEDFMAAARHFGVGAQNWVYADVNGNIAYAAFNRVPVREHLATAPVDYPPWLPFPGTGCCEWDGEVPLDDMPHTVNPTRGYVFTANGDALGYTLDGDPLNDKSYQGYGFAIGYRAARVGELFEQALAAEDGFTVASVQAIQADTLSPLGRSLTPFILEAYALAQQSAAREPGVDPSYEAFVSEEMTAAVERLKAWSFNAASGFGDDGLPSEDAAVRADSVATSIFNAWLVHVSAAVLENKGVAPYDLGMQAKFLGNLFHASADLATWDDTIQDSLLWDDVATENLVEDRTVIILTALAEALEFLANGDRVGPAEAGGFGVAEMDEWLWGKLHAIALKSPLGGEANIPAESAFPAGYPRGGDNFCLDAAHPGLSDTRFTYTSGAAIRNVFDCKADGIVAHTVIPGGEDASFGTPHYKDLFDLWKTNQTHLLSTTVPEIKAKAEACLRLLP